VFWFSTSLNDIWCKWTLSYNKSDLLREETTPIKQLNNLWDRHYSQDADQILSVETVENTDSVIKSQLKNLGFPFQTLEKLFILFSKKTWLWFDEKKIALIFLLTLSESRLILLMTLSKQLCYRPIVRKALKLSLRK